MATQTAPSSSNPYMYYVLTKNGIEVRYKRSGQFAYLLPKGSTRYKNALKKRYTGTYRQQYGTDNSNNNNSGGGTGGSGNSSTTTRESTDSTSSESTTTKYQWVQKTVEEPITTYEEAVKFGKLEVNKARRNNGHSIECKVIGSNRFKEGEWALVQIPSFEINDYMYITKTDNTLTSNDEWVTSITLTDYPPSISKGESNKIEDENDDSTADNNGDDITSTDTTSTSGNSTTSNTTSNTTSSNKSVKNRIKITGSRDATYATRESNGNWILRNSKGYMVGKVTKGSSTAKKYDKISGR